MGNIDISDYAALAEAAYADFSKSYENLKEMYSVKKRFGLKLRELANPARNSLQNMLQTNTK